MPRAIYSGIYVITNNINNKKYVGQSVNLKARIKKHLNKNSNSAISYAIKKYGWDNFSLNLYYVEIENLDLIEQIMISVLNTISPNGYNLREGGNSSRPSEISREKMSIAKKGNTNASGCRSDTARLNISKSQSGKKLSDAHKSQLSISGTGIKRKIVECPFCGVQGGQNAMKRHHFDNCKSNIKNANRIYPKIQQKRQICPHCNKECGQGASTRYHFDNCELKL